MNYRNLDGPNRALRGCYEPGESALTLARRNISPAARSISDRLGPTSSTRPRLRRGPYRDSLLARPCARVRTIYSQQGVPRKPLLRRRGSAAGVFPPTTSLMYEESLRNLASDDRRAAFHVWPDVD